MNTERWEQTKQIIEQALRLALEQREAYLDLACGTDCDLRAEVESLIASHEAAGSQFLAFAAPEILLTSSSDLEKAVPDRVIGHYRLIEELGRGGMGQVWLAEQTAPVRRQVALKLINGGMFDTLAQQRFQSERQSLAMMDHPSIAKVFDAGATADGQPYFVMEYVSGTPITDYCDQKKLMIPERLELFTTVCEGVQHAHQKAIIHRDLKPANILVVELDGKPLPRIIDFGLAKSATADVLGETQFTKTGSFLGTPGYMSPEQANSGVQDVDTRTDVYSLGAVLYVLLTGLLPFESEYWQKQPLHEAFRQLHEEDPPRPSTKTGSHGESRRTRAAARGTEPKHLVSLLRGDLDGIAMKALERDRARRYATPSELTADIRRYLRHEPVQARPASVSYRMKKYVRRHRIGVAAAGMLAAVIVAFAAVQSVQLRRITRERDRADRIAEFMTGMFKVSDPSESRGNSIRVREIIDKASKDIDTGLAKDPELQAQMMHVMGTVYTSLGLYPRAESLLRQTSEIRQRTLGSEHPDSLRSKALLARVLVDEAQYSQAEKLFRETLDIQRRVLGPQHSDTLGSMNGLASVLFAEGRYAEAEKLYRETLEIQHRVLGPDHPDTIGSMNGLATTLATQRRYAEVEEVEQEALDIRSRVLGPDHPDTLESATRLATTLSTEGRYPEAEKLYRETLDIQHRVLGPDHPNTLWAVQGLAWTLAGEGRYAEAEKLYRETFDIQRRVLGPEHRDTLESATRLALTLSTEGRSPEAEKLERETLDIQRRVLGPEHPNTLGTMEVLGTTLLDEGNYLEAEKLLRETRDRMRRVYGPESPYTASSTYNLACVAARRHYRDEALSLLREAADHGLAPSEALGMEKDPDLKSLHGDPRFSALVAHAKESAGAQKAK